MLQEYAHASDKMVTKGISLTINTLVYMSIAVIVLIAIVSLIQSMWWPGVNPMLCEADLKTECSKFVSAGGCKNPPETSISNSQFEKLREIADKCYQISGQEIIDRCCK